ncbi:MAG: PAS domain-containing protein [Bacteroidales bacterium]|nr:PAS domain-containing protein [Bacteroidales bacterium]
MIFRKKISCIVSNDLLIQDVSPKLLHLLQYSAPEELIHKHILVILPKYFFYFKGGEWNIHGHYAILRKKDGSVLVTRAIMKQKKYQYYLSFRVLKNNYLIKYFNNEIQLNNHIQNIEEVGILCFNKQGFIISANAKVCSWYNESEGEVYNKKIENLLNISKQTFDELLININETPEKKISKIFSNQHNTFRWEIAKVISPFGEYYLSFIYDDTNIKTTQKELEYQRTLFQKIFELSPLPIFIFNKQYRIENVNQSFLDLLEVDRNIAEGLDLKMLFDKRPFYVYEQVLENKTESVYEGYYQTTYRGKTIFSRLMATPVEIENETKGLGIILDFTKQKKIEEELTEKRNFYKTMVEMAIAGIGITDLNENIIFVNKAFANMLGYEENELVGTNLQMICSPLQYETFKKQSELRKQKKNSIYEATLIHKNGQTISALIFSAPYMNANQEVIGTLGVLVDISYQKILLNLYERVKEENIHLQTERSIITNAIWKRFNFFLPTLIELLKLDKTHLNNYQLVELQENIQKNITILSITYIDLQLLIDILTGKYKAKQSEVSLWKYLDGLKNYYQQYDTTNKYCEIYWHFDVDDILIEFPETTVNHCIERIIHNLVFRNQASHINISVNKDNAQITFVFEMYHPTSLQPVPILNFNENHLCHFLVFKLLQEINGSITISETNISISVPYFSVQSPEFQSLRLNQPENRYSTYLWNNKTILYYTPNNIIDQLIQKTLQPTYVQLIWLPTDTQFIHNALKYPFADVFLIDISEFDDTLSDYLSFIRKYLPDTKIVAFTNKKMEEKNYTIFDELIMITDKFADELIKTLIKFL